MACVKMKNGQVRKNGESAAKKMAIEFAFFPYSNVHIYNLHMCIYARELTHSKEDVIDKIE